jgi:hypothetical protein
MGKSGDGSAAGTRVHAAGPTGGFLACALALGLATAGCPGGFNGLGPIPAEAGEHLDPDDAQAGDAQAGDAVARDSGAPETDPASHDSEAPHHDAAARDSATPEHDATAEDAPADGAVPDALDAAGPDAGDAQDESDAGCDPIACMTPSCCGDSCQTVHSNGVGGTYYDCDPLGTYSSSAAMAACVAFAGGDASKCTDGWNCQDDSSIKQVCYVDGSNHCQMYCWTYAGTMAGVLSDCSCPVTSISPWN